MGKWITNIKGIDRGRYVRLPLILDHIVRIARDMPQSCIKKKTRAPPPPPNKQTKNNYVSEITFIRQDAIIPIGKSPFIFLKTRSY